MQHGKRSAQWDHTAALIIHMRRCIGDKVTKYEDIHPYAEIDQRKEFKKLFGK